MPNREYRTQRCPHCGTRISAASSTCSACGKPMDAEAAPEQKVPSPAPEKQHQPGSPHKKKRSTSRGLILGAAGAAVLLCLCMAMAAGLGLTAFRRDLRTLFRPDETGGLQDVSRDQDGTVSGTYLYPYSLDFQEVVFSVTADGEASIALKGSPEEELSISMGSITNASMSWNGSTMDGYGSLSPAEQAALEELMSSDLEYALNEIALDLGCLEEETVDPGQVASLLFPLQMKFKYMVSDRQAAAQSVAVRSDCRYHVASSAAPRISSVIELNAANPVPVVFGYFPFDNEGALEPAVSLPEGARLACLHPDSQALSWPPGANASTASPARMDEYGACGAMCRGACGPDCIRSNCSMETELRCVEDEQLRYTGMVTQVIRYTCGMHQGCIDHDACYDACNEEYGCSTWSASFCRHGQLQGATATFESAYCDQRAIEEHGYSSSLLWMRGYGDQPMTETFEYTDTDFQVYEDTDLCPADEKQPVEWPETDPTQDAAQTAPTEGSPTESAGEESAVVPTAEPTESVEVPPAARADVHPCDLLPAGGENINREDDSCFASYPGDLSVKITKYSAEFDAGIFCPIEVDTGFAIPLSEVDIGDCGFVSRRGVDGEPDVFGYVGWDLRAVIMPYVVNVGTHEIYPGNEGSVYGTMYGIEAQIMGQ